MGGVGKSDGRVFGLYSADYANLTEVADMSTHEMLTRLKPLRH